MLFISNIFSSFPNHKIFILVVFYYYWFVFMIWLSEVGMVAHFFSLSSLSNNEWGTNYSPLSILDFLNISYFVHLLPTLTYYFLFLKKNLKLSDNV